MFEFITIRELYEMFLSNQVMDLEGYEYVELEGDDMMLFDRLMGLLNDCDDVDEVYHNVSNYDDGEEE